MDRTYIDYNLLREDGKLYHNCLLDCVEALIPNAFASVHAADLLELPNGDLLCAWFAGSDEGNADISIAVSRLPAGASQWENARIVSDDPERSEQNPSLFLTPAGEVWLMYTAQVSRPPEGSQQFNLQYTAEIRRKVSKDLGYSWGETEVMFERPGSFCRQKIQVLSNGRWIFGNWICFPDESRNGSDITVVQISDDEGKTWRCVDVPESQGRVHGNIVEMENGKLLMLLRSRFADNIYLSSSEDYGENWTVPVRTELPNNNSSISAIRLQSGGVAVVYNEVRFNDDTEKTVWPHQRCPVTVAISDDGGKTWPYKRIIENGEGFVGRYNDINNRRYEYPVMMQGRDGKIHVAYSYRTRKCVKYVCVDESWIRGKKMLPGAEGDPQMPCQR